MIPFLTVAKIVQKIGREIGVTIIREDQQGKHPNFPYGSYKILNSQQENDYQDIKSISVNGTDSTSVDITSYEKSETLVSLTFFDKNKTSRIIPLASAAISWIKTVEAKDFFYNNDVVVRLLDPNIVDRTVYLDSYFQTKYGFDFRIDYSGVNIETIESIERAIIENEIDDVPQSDIDVNLT